MKTEIQRNSPAVLIAQIVSLAVFLLMWEWAAKTKTVDPLFIGQPTKIFAYLYHSTVVDQVLLQEAAWTLSETAAAFVLGGGTEAFAARYTLHARYVDVKGLKPGAVVRLAGIWWRTAAAGANQISRPAARMRRIISLSPPEK